MEWPSIVTSFFAQQPHAAHHEGINYAPLLSLGGNQHPNQQMVNFEATGSVITGNSNVRYSTQAHRQLNLSNLEAIQQVNHNHVHAPVATTSSAIPAHIHHVPEPEPQPHIIQNNDPVETDGRSSSHSSSRHTAAPAPVTERKAFTCKQCGEVFQNEEALMQHLRFFHKDVMPFPCQLCNDKFEKRSLLQNHLRKRHHVDTPKSTKKVIKLDNGFFGCDLCDRTFNRQFKVYAHRKTHFPKRFKCNMCDQMFFEKKYMILHIERHKKTPSGRVMKYGPPQKKELAYFCQQCEKGFTLERSLELHIQVIHQGIKPYNCHLCELGFWKYIYLKSHCKRVHGCEAKPTVAKRKPGPRSDKLVVKKEKLPKRTFLTKRNINGARSRRNRHARDPKFFCEFCSQDYTNQKVFILHQQTHLGVEKKTPCWLCTEYFINEDKMNEHLLEIHNQEPVKHAPRASSGYYECQDCDDVFQRSRKYYFHRLKKHGEKRIVCSFCQKGFVSIGTYKCHRNIHVGAKPFLCPYCKVGFANRANLNIHVIRSHYRYNPLWCGACNKIYASEDMFKTHREEHEGSAPFMCPTCYKGFDDEEEHAKHVAGFHKPMVDKKYTCHQCRKGFAYPKLLQRHIQICNKPKLKQFKCQFCERRYSYMCSLKDHYKKCPKNVNKWRPEPARKKPSPPVKSVAIPDNVTEMQIHEDYACKLCLFPFPTRREALNHVKEKHPKKEPEQSIICCFRKPHEERDYSKEDELLLAEPEIFIRLINFYCQICKIPYCSPSLLDKHVVKYHPSFFDRYKELSEEMTPTTGLTRLRTTTRRSSGRREEKTDTDYEEIDRCSNDDTRETDALVDDHESQEDDNTEDSELDEVPAPKLPKKKVIKELPQEIPRRKSARLNKDFSIPEEPSTPKYFSCKTCKSLFNDKKAIEKHTKKYHPAGNPISEKDKLEFEYICELCDMHYTEQDGLLTHIESDHEDIYLKINSEKENGKESTSNDNDRNFIEDLDDLIDEDDLSCKVCDIKYSKRFFLKKHIEKYHPNYPNEEPPVKHTSTEPDLQCKVCNITYHLQSYLDKHIEKYHNNYPNEDIIEDVDPAYIEKNRRAKIALDEDLTCAICDIKYHKAIFLEKHIEKYHPNYPEKSGEEITVENNMAQDALSNSKKYKCPVCPVSYSLEPHWVRHMEIFHQNFSLNESTKVITVDDWDCEMNKFVCKFCKIEYTKEYYLSKHIEKLHPNYYEKKEPEEEEDDSLHYYCKVCNLPYLYRNNLENHIQKYHPDYYIVYAEDYRPLYSETEKVTPAEAQDSNATEIEEARVDDPIQKPTEVPLKPMPPLKPLYPPQAPIVTSSVQPSHSNHHQNLNLQGHPNQFNSSNSAQTQSRGNCLYQQPRHPVEHRSHQPTQSGFQNCYLQQHNILPQPNTANTTNNHNTNSEVNPSNYSNYNNPCDALSFLDNHLREEQIRVEPNANCHFNRAPPVQPPIPERTNFFDNHIIPGTDFSYWDRAINQPVNVANNVASSSFGMGNYNPSDPPSFHALQSRHHDRNNVFPGVSTGQTNPVVSTVVQDSDGDDPFDIPDTGFGLNYESDDSCDNPKVNEKKGTNDPTKNANAPKKVNETKVNKFEEHFLQYSKKADEESEESKKKEEEEAIKEAKSKAFFCKKCPMYYLRDYFLDKHYQKEHPDFWKEIQEERAKKKQGDGLFVKDNPDETSEVRKGALECKICSNLYNTEVMMLKHYKNLHADNPDAASAIEELETLIKKVEKAKADYHYVCEICSKTYQRKLTLQKHYSTTHMNIRPFSCNECDKTFTSKHSMVRHMQNVHINPNRTFDCEKCGAKFRKKESLVKHNKNKPDCLERKQALEAEKDKPTPKKPRAKRSTSSRKKKSKDSSSDSEEEQNKPPPRKSTRTRKLVSKSREFLESEPGGFSEVEEIPVKTKRKKMGRAANKRQTESEEGSLESEEGSLESEEEKPKSKKMPKSKTRRYQFESEEEIKSKKNPKREETESEEGSLESEEEKPKSKKKSKFKKRDETENDTSNEEEKRGKSTRKKNVTWKKKKVQEEYDKESSSSNMEDSEGIVKGKPENSKRAILKIKFKKIEYEDAVSNSDDGDLDISKLSKNSDLARKSKDESKHETVKKDVSKRKLETEEESTNDHASNSDASIEYSPNKAKTVKAVENSKEESASSSSNPKINTKSDSNEVL